MSIGVFAKKIGMMQIFNESGTIFPVTLLKFEGCQISGIKTSNLDGYDAIQVAFNSGIFYKLKKPKQGQLEKNWAYCNDGCKIFKSFGEFRIKNPQNFKLCQNITLESFKVGQKVCVTGKSIGKGFTGNQKRHNFNRGPLTHGSKNHKLPGSIGAGSTPGRVYPGKKMAGRQGSQKVTIKNSEIICINMKDQILMLKGSLPCKTNTFLKVKPKN